MNKKWNTKKITPKQQKRLWDFITCVLNDQDSIKLTTDTIKSGDFFLLLLQRIINGKMMQTSLTRMYWCPNRNLNNVIESIRINYFTRMHRLGHRRPRTPLSFSCPSGILTACMPWACNWRRWFFSIIIFIFSSSFFWLFYWKNLTLADLLVVKGNPLWENWTTVQLKNDRIIHLTLAFSLW